MIPPHADHVTREEMHDLTVRHLLIIVWIDYLQKKYQVLLLVQHPHLNKQLSELVLIDHPVPVRVHLLEDLRELVQELLMLGELEVQDRLLELNIGQLFMDQVRIEGYSVEKLLTGKLLLGH